MCNYCNEGMDNITVDGLVSY